MSNKETGLGGAFSASPIIAEAGEEAQNPGDNKGVFIPKWVIVSVVAPVIAGGIGACTFIAAYLTDQSKSLAEQSKSAAIQIEKMNQITEKIDLNNEQLKTKIDANNQLMLQAVGSLEKRVNRLEDSWWRKRDGGSDQ